MRMAARSLIDSEATRPLPIKTRNSTSPTDSAWRRYGPTPLVFSSGGGVTELMLAAVARSYQSLAIMPCTDGVVPVDSDVCPGAVSV